MDDVEIIKKRRKINNIRYRKNVYVPKMKALSGIAEEI